MGIWRSSSIGGLKYAPLPPVIHGCTMGCQRGIWFWKDPISDPQRFIVLSLGLGWWDHHDWLAIFIWFYCVCIPYMDPRGIYDIRAELKGVGGSSGWSDPHTITSSRTSHQFPTSPLPLMVVDCYFWWLIILWSDGTITTWSWDFGDGDTVLGRHSPISINIGTYMWPWR